MNKYPSRVVLATTNLLVEIVPLGGSAKADYGAPRLGARVESE